MLAALCVEYARADYEARLWKMIAFLSRYARQPLSSVRELTRRECSLLVRATEEILDEEEKASQRAAGR